MNITDYEESLRSTVRLARLTFSSAAASVFLYREERDVLVFEAASGAGEDRIIGMDVPAGQGIVGWVARTGEPILVREVSSDERFDLRTAAETGFIPDTIMAIPLIQHGEVIGVMEVLDPLLGSYGDIEALDMLSELANQAAMIISMVPPRRSPEDSPRAVVAREFDALLDRVPDDRIQEVDRLIAAIRSIVV
ncbi:GAF domain-containing protein [Kitasatospora sp. NPDC088783]|uniref:GAF domain-containing protein n=1 Tax=Kitasatospora sp. NPDC088783 TaxID=3364077 RepID=UPI003819B41D